jgi:hypothetical protein
MEFFAMTQTEQLQDVLSIMERTLLAPVISGELETWAEAARDAVCEGAPVIRECVELLHRSEIKAIRKEDPELSVQATRLAEADVQILHDMDRLCAELTELAKVAPKVEPNEAPAADIADRISKKGIDLIISVRRQEEAIKAWQHEAMARDRGPVD